MHTLLIFIVTLCLAQCSMAMNQCFGPILNPGCPQHQMCVATNPTTNLSVNTLSDCDAACTAYQDCVSYNYIKGAGNGVNGSDVCDLFTYVTRNYIVNDNCTSYRATVYNPYHPPQSPGNCSAELRSYGDNDNNGFLAWVKLNGRMFLDASYQMTGSVVGHMRGTNTILLNFETCTAYEPMWFDTCGDLTASARFTAYIKTIPTGVIVFAVTADDAFSSFHADSIQTIQNLGGPNLAGNSQWAVRSKFTLIAQIGSPAKTAFQLGPNSGANIVMTRNIWGTSLSDVAITP